MHKTHAESPSARDCGILSLVVGVPKEIHCFVYYVVWGRRILLPC